MKNTRFLIKTFYLAAICFAMPSGACAEEDSKLTDREKNLYLSRLLSLKREIELSNIDVMGDASKAFHDAMQTDEKAFRLFQECVAKVQQEESTDSNQSTREKLRKTSSNVSGEFKRAIRYQLYWLSCSLEASRHSETRPEQIDKLAKSLIDIVSDTKGLSYSMLFNKLPAGSDARGETKAEVSAGKSALGGKVISPLHQDPFTSAFAKAYKVGHLRPDSWPKHPLDFKGLFEDLMFKDLADIKQFSKARKLWKNRLLAESYMHKNFGLKPESGGAGSEPLSYVKYKTEIAPELQWNAEAKLFEAGDERAAFVEMIKLLESQKAHPKYLEWIQWITGKLDVDAVIGE